MFQRICFNSRICIQIGLRSLVKIQSGYVFISNCSRLCYADTVSLLLILIKVKNSVCKCIDMQSSHTLAFSNSIFISIGLIKKNRSSSFFHFCCCCCKFNSCADVCVFCIDRYKYAESTWVFIKYATYAVKFCSKLLVWCVNYCWSLDHNFVFIYFIL